MSFFQEHQLSQLHEGCAQLGIELNEQAVDRLALFSEMIYRANESFNLTRIPAEELVTRHLLDSLLIVAVADMDASRNLLDVGTGAGFPGMVIAIAFPHIHCVLMDARRKRLSVLDTIAIELNLRNVSTVHSRAEIGSEQLARRGYDLVTARAVAPLSRLAGWTIPHISARGKVVAYKSSEATDEIEASREAVTGAGGVIERVVPVSLPCTDVVRLMVVINKAKPQSALTTKGSSADKARVHTSSVRRKGN